MLLKEVIEALLFASQKPLTTKELVAALRAAVEDSDEEPAHALATTKVVEVETVLGLLKEEYALRNNSFQLVEQASGWAVVTRPEYALWVRQLYPESKPSRLSGPALETLAIIAYRQPITRADIEAVRGVAVDGVMQSLTDKGLVRIAGRAEVPGRPLLYETTQVFMEHFGLRHLQELPNSDELRRIPLPAAKPAEPAADTPAEAEPTAETEPAVAETEHSTAEAEQPIAETAAPTPAELPFEEAPAEAPPADSETPNPAS